MYGGIGDIWRDYGRRRKTDGVSGARAGLLTNGEGVRESQRMCAVGV